MSSCRFQSCLSSHINAQRARQREVRASERCARVLYDWASHINVILPNRHKCKANTLCLPSECGFYVLVTEEKPGIEALSIRSRYSWLILSIRIESVVSLSIVLWAARLYAYWQKKWAIFREYTHCDTHEWDVEPYAIDLLCGSMERHTLDYIVGILIGNSFAWRDFWYFLNFHSSYVFFIEIIVESNSKSRLPLEGELYQSCEGKESSLQPRRWRTKSNKINVKLIIKRIQLHHGLFWKNNLF